MNNSIFCLLVFNAGLIIASAEDFSWQWTCNKNAQCTRSNSSSNIDLQSTNVPLDVCRLTCGTHGALWPIPTIKTNIGSNIIDINPRKVTFNISSLNVDVRDYLNKVGILFTKNLDAECGGICNIDTDNNVVVQIRTESEDMTLRMGVDESYSLRVTTTGTTVEATITASTIFGARHALETLSQLTASYRGEVDPSGAACSGLVIVSEAGIADKPKYSYRGLLLDTARNYLTLNAIRRQIDAMAASKMNVLHWHATDSQSFPVQSVRVPNLSRYGAYSPAEVYTLTDIANLVRYAKYRGVRILMEVDAPSHAGNGWQWGEEAQKGALAVCVNQKPWRAYCIQPPCGQLNPINQNVYTVLGDLYKDLAEALPVEEQFHMGGDEVFFPCWNSTDEIIAYLARHGKGRQLSDFLDLWSDFQKQALEAFDAQVKHSRTPITLWSSDLTNPAVIEKYLSPERYIIETWLPASSDVPNILLDKGYRLIVSTKDAWYLDHGFWGSTTYYTWRVAYKNRIPSSSHPGVLGGEVCMWGELVDDNSLDTRVWPRAAAAAERLWADPNLDTGVVEPRFYRHRERLVGRGIKAEAVAPGWCTQNEGQCQ